MLSSVIFCFRRCFFGHWSSVASPIHPAVLVYHYPSFLGQTLFIFVDYIRISSASPASRHPLPSLVHQTRITHLFFIASCSHPCYLKPWPLLVLWRLLFSHYLSSPTHPFSNYIHLLRVSLLYSENRREKVERGTLTGLLVHSGNDRLNEPRSIVIR